SLCANSNFFFCENFESGNFPASWGQPYSPEGTPPVIDSVMPARGLKGMHINAFHTAMMGLGHVFPVNSPSYAGTFYVRFFAYFDKIPTKPTHFDIFDTSGDDSSGPNFGLHAQGEGGDKEYFIIHLGGSLGDTGVYDDKPIPLKK